MSWILLSLISAVFSAAAAISQKKVLQSLPALHFSLLVSLLTLVFCIPFLFGIDFDKISSISVYVLFGKTILTALAFWLVMLSIQKLQISLALPLMVLTPGLVAIFGFFLLGESLLWFQIFGMILLVIGTYILELEKNTKFYTPFLNLLKSPHHGYILGALILFTTTSILDAALLKKFKLHPYSMTVLQQAFSVIIFGLILIIESLRKRNVLQADMTENLEKAIASQNNLWTILKKHWIWLTWIAFFTIVYRYTQIEATKLAPAVALVLSLKRVSVFFSAVIGGKIFREQNLPQRIIAVIIMLIGATLIMKD